MVVRAAMVQLLLARQGFSVALEGNADCVIYQVRAWRPRANEPGTLYVRWDGKSCPPTRDDGPCACLRIAPRAENAKNTSRAIREPQAKDSSPQAPVGLEPVYEAMLDLERWDAALKDALLEGATFDEFIALGSAMIQRPIAYFDRNLIALASSSDYWERDEVSDGGRAASRFSGQMPPDMAVDLVEDIDYLRAAEERGGFYYQSAQHRMFYGVNTFDGDEYLARLVISLAEGEQRLHRGEEQLIDVFHARLDDLHLRYAGNAQVASSQNDSLHVLVRTELLGSKPHGRDEASAVLNAFGWSYNDRFLVAKLVFFEGVHWDTVSLYICNLLEQTVSGSCALSEKQQIVWMMNLTRAARPGETSEQLSQRATESLVAILRNYACKAGLSDVFASFSAARNHFVEAERAIEVGQVRDPHHWYYRFSHYAFDYLLARCADELSPEQVCHPALTALAAYDAEHATEYARTLVCFLRNNQNTTHAADELYIHRTSFMRRMAHIQTLTGVDLGDADEVTHLLLSAKLLRM